MDHDEPLGPRRVHAQQRGRDLGGVKGLWSHNGDRANVGETAGARASEVVAVGDVVRLPVAAQSLGRGCGNCGGSYDEEKKIRQSYISCRLDD